MPLHLGSIVKEEQKNELLAPFFACVNDCENYVCSLDGRFLHLRKNMVDTITK